MGLTAHGRDIGIDLVGQRAEHDFVHRIMPVRRAQHR